MRILEFQRENGTSVYVRSEQVMAVEDAPGLESVVVHLNGTMISVDALSPDVDAMTVAVDLWGSPLEDAPRDHVETGLATDVWEL